MITSSMSGEGKSFIAANFGAAISLSGTRTVILEFDIRKPRLLKTLGMRSSTGLSNYHIGKAELDARVRCVVAAAPRAGGADSGARFAGLSVLVAPKGGRIPLLRTQRAFLDHPDQSQLA